MERIKQQAAHTAQLLKLIANANRLIILHLLRDGEASVGDLEQNMRVSQPALSQHLARMRQEGLLESKRVGQQIFYSIKDKHIMELVDLIEKIFNEIGDLSNYKSLDFSSKQASP
jgi:ArsR family transcriptional regulator, virulence genes transcriptional regulator